jgi:CubicO group peptidase (beta-lactamase class C family)
MSVAQIVPLGQVDIGRRAVLRWGVSAVALPLGTASCVLPGKERKNEPAATEDVVARLVGGRWQCLTEEDGLEFPVELRFERDAAGQLSGIFEARDLALPGLPLQELTIEQDRLRARIEVLQARLTARVHRDHLDAEFAGRHLTGRDYVYAVRLLRDNPKVRPYLVPRLNTRGERQTSYTYAPPQNLGDGWPVGRLEDVGMVPSLIESAVVAILDGRYPWIESLVIVRRGILVLDEYFYGRAPQMLKFLQSATKSVTSLLVGIAIDRGDLRSVDVPVHSFFGDYGGRRWVDKRYDITLRQALAMTAGLEWNETLPYTDLHNDNLQMNRSGDWIGYVLDRPSRPKTPGWFEYMSGLSILLGGVLHRATGQRVDAFAREHLFEPLGIDRFEWTCRPDGTCHTGAGLSLRPRDLAKLGQVVLNGGAWGGRRLVSDAWIRESTAVHSSTDAITYGYQWWLSRGLPLGEGEPLIMARGLGDQFLLIMPRHELVVVSTAKVSENTAALLLMLREHILPAAGAQPKGR